MIKVVSDVKYDHIEHSLIGNSWGSMVAKELSQILQRNKVQNILEVNKLAKQPLRTFGVVVISHKYKCLSSVGNKDRDSSL